MSTLDTQIRNRVESFVAELTGLIRQAAVDAAVSALNGQRGATYTGAKRGPKPGAAAAGRKGTRVRRTEQQIQSTMKNVLEFIASKPGSRSEDVRSGLGLPAATMADALKRLMADKSIKSKGQRRGTTYAKA